MSGRDAAADEDDAYVMPAYTKLLVSDPARSRAFYEALGFQLRTADPVFTHLRWARHADLFLVSTPPGVPFATPRGTGVILCFSVVDSDLDSLASRARAAGASVFGPHPQPWHTLELLVTDPDGFRLCFVTPQ